MGSGEDEQADSHRAEMTARLASWPNLRAAPGVGEAAMVWGAEWGCGQSLTVTVRMLKCGTLRTC